MPSGTTSQQHVANMANSAGWVETLGAHRHTILDTMAAEDAEWIIQFGEALIGRGITTVGQEAIGLEQASRADKLVRVPPERRATG